MTTSHTPGAVAPAGHAVPAPPTFSEALRFWLKLGFISFGGPTGQIAIMHAELVEKRRWIDEARFLHALNYCMLLPGPEAQQLATYIGWLLHRTWGGLVAGTLFVLPSALLLWVLSYVYVAHGNVPWIAAVFAGLKPAVIAIVAAAVLRIGRRALRSAALWSLAGAAFIAIFLLGVPFPLIILGAGLIGLLGRRLQPAWFPAAMPHGTGSEARQPRAEMAVRSPRGLRRALRVLSAGLLIWWAPVAAAALWLGPAHILVRQGLFFSKAALVTFGGAYAVLPYVAQQAVQTHDWLSAGQMLDGLALAETTPGPLIMVLQFVGFVGGWQNPGGFSPVVAATLGAAMTTWVTFAPCFLWIFLGAPYLEGLRQRTELSAALSAITAAVVGVVLNLAVWFALHTLVPSAGRVDWVGVVIAASAFGALTRLRVDVIPVVLGAAIIGLLRGATGV